MGNCCCCGFWGLDTDVELTYLPEPAAPADWQGEGAPWLKEKKQGPKGSWEPFAGNIPEKTNVSWSRPCNAPAEVAFSCFIRDHADGGKFMTIKKGVEGTSLFPGMLDGAVVAFENLNYKLVSASKDHPMNFTYRVFKTEVPAFNGLTAVISFIPEPNDAEKCSMVFNGKFDNNAPCAVLSFVTCNIVLGPIVKVAEKEWKDKSYAKHYEGPPIDSAKATMK